MDRNTVDTMQKIREMKNFGVPMARRWAYPTRERDRDVTPLARLPRMLLAMASAWLTLAGSISATSSSYHCSTRCTAGSICVA